MAFPSNPDDPASSTNEAELRASFAKVLATGEPDMLPVQRYPIPLEGPDGTVTFDERFWSAYSAGIRRERRHRLHLPHDQGRYRADPFRAGPA